jgi:hypothetical protein
MQKRILPMSTGAEKATGKRQIVGILRECLRVRRPANDKHMAIAFEGKEMDVHYMHHCIFAICLSELFSVTVHVGVGTSQMGLNGYLLQKSAHE